MRILMITAVALLLSAGTALADGGFDNWGAEYYDQVIDSHSGCDDCARNYSPCGHGGCGGCTDCRGQESARGASHACGSCAKSKCSPCSDCGQAKCESRAHTRSAVGPCSSCGGQKCGHVQAKGCSKCGGDKCGHAKAKSCDKCGGHAAAHSACDSCGKHRGGCSDCDFQPCSHCGKDHHGDWGYGADDSSWAWLYD